MGSRQPPSQTIRMIMVQQKVQYLLLYFCTTFVIFTSVLLIQNSVICPHLSQGSYANVPHNHFLAIVQSCKMIIDD